MGRNQNGTQHRIHSAQHQKGLNPEWTELRMGLNICRIDLTPKMGENRIEREEELQRLVSNFFNMEMNLYVDALITFSCKSILLIYSLIDVQRQQ
jgi:hypothetical protein